MKKLSAKRSVSGTTFGRATTSAEIARVHPVMRELRPHHADERAFVRQVLKQMREGFRLVYLENNGEIRAAAGYRMYDLLYSGRTLYVDDLVTREVDRSKGLARSYLTGWWRKRGARIAAS
jgi:hypothetical protein